MKKEKFIIKANKVHNNKYDYSKFIYTGVHKNGIIICYKHGEFLQTPGSHYSGKDCINNNIRLIRLRDYNMINNILEGELKI
jgi:hypothetical protein